MKMSQRRLRGGLIAMAASALVLAGCAGQPTRSASQNQPDAPPVAVEADGEEIASNARFVLYRVAEGDTLASIATRILGDADLAWRIADYNEVKRPTAGQILAIPRTDLNPLGVSGSGFQTVPILCYHRFGSGKSKMIVSESRFAEQMAWLARNDYRVIPLASLEAFLDGKRALPERAVVITIDDGYKTVYQHAYPILRKYGFPATVFLYTDFVGAGDALTWQQMKEMTDSGLVDIQAHSRTHSNLIERKRGEDEAAYQARVRDEVSAPRAAIEARLPIKVRRYAYPYGDANQRVLDELEQNRYDLGLTVNPGGNGFFAEKYMLHRTMIYGDHSLAAFKARVETRRPLDNP
ncbi:MAG: polysaccharide deacetylase family protein [Rhodocyclaceae bacterium]|nr:polysaccharide deacetylase family protein [Rhodocyclaceae bacterium]